MLRAAVEREGNREIAGTLCDEAASAFKADRGPGLVQARELAKHLADERGTCELWVMHSDRLARGDARGAAHLVEYVVWARKVGVTLRSVEDPDSFRDLIYAAMMGERNHEHSARNARATAAGKRRTAERGEWVGGICPDGYRVLHEVDNRGSVTRRVVKDPDRAQVLELIFQLALAGWSDGAIVLELDRRGFLTAPLKQGARPRSFDANRVGQTLRNHFYAGMSVHRGRLVGKGNWPAFVSYREFRHLQDRRRARAHADRPRSGRPPEGYVLARVATCGVCGSSMDVVTGRYARKDASRARRYVCRTHRVRPRDCEAAPIDAGIVDRAFVANLTGFLGDVEAWRGRLVESREAERARLLDEVDRALAHCASENAKTGRLRSRYELALQEGDDAGAEELLAMLRGRQAERNQAERRVRAAKDALASTQQERNDVDSLLDFYNRLSAELDGRVSDACGDIRRLNVIVREFFVAVTLTAYSQGVVLLPVLTQSAAERVAKNMHYWPERLVAQAETTQSLAILSMGEDGVVFGANDESVRFLWKAADGAGCSFEFLEAGELQVMAAHKPTPLIATGAERIVPPLREISTSTRNPHPPS